MPLQPAPDFHKFCNLHPQFFCLKTGHDDNAYLRVEGYFEEGLDRRHGAAPVL